MINDSPPLYIFFLIKIEIYLLVYHNQMNQQTSPSMATPKEDVIEFTIQCLEGNTFSVSITRAQAEKVFTYTTRNPYNSYGLDFLKDAISKQNGADPTTQQLFTSDDELTTATPLIRLTGKVITLMIKPPITVTLKNVAAAALGIYALPLESHIDFLKGISCGEKYHSQSTVCYIHVPCSQEDGPKIQAVGMNRDFFKIHIKNLPFALLRASALSYFSEPFILPNLFHKESSQHLWLRYDKNVMHLD